MYVCPQLGHANVQTTLDKYADLFDGREQVSPSADGGRIRRPRRWKLARVPAAR